MLGFDQVLNSSSSSLSSASDLDTASNEADENERTSSKVFIKHLRKCFIANDDNSYCEQTILPDLKVFSEISDKNKLANKQEYLRTILSKRINSKSYEYIKASNNRAYMANDKSQVKYFRMNSTNLEAASESAEIKYESMQHHQIDENVDTAEESKITSGLTFEIKKEPTKIVPIVSPLTILINQSSNEKNPFLEYLRHEAYVQDPNMFKKFRIFLPMCTAATKYKTKKEFMVVNVLKSARICDLIGLICCKYVAEKRTPPLKLKQIRSDNVNGYYLKIAEDTGEVELELAPLESSQKVGRFGFNDLALVEKEDLSEPNSPFLSKTNPETTFNFPVSGASSKQVRIIVHFTDGLPDAFIYFDSENISMEKVYEEILKIKLANINIFCPKLVYRLEHADQPGTAINIEKTFLNDFKTNPSRYEFYFFRENSVRKTSPKDSPNKTAPDPDADLTKKINQTYEYDVTYLSKWRKVPFKIEISKDNFELEEIKPVEITKLRLTSKISNFYTIPTKHVVSCGYLKEKEAKGGSGKPQIRIIVVEEEPILTYKHLDFECETKQADDIINTFNQFILFINSVHWKMYNQSKKKSIKWSRRLFNSERLKQQQNSFRRSSVV